VRYAITMVINHVLCIAIFFGSSWVQRRAVWWREEEEAIMAELWETRLKASD